MAPLASLLFIEYYHLLLFDMFRFFFCFPAVAVWRHDGGRLLFPSRARLQEVRTIPQPRRRRLCRKGKKIAIPYLSEQAHRPLLPAGAISTPHGVRLHRILPASESTQRELSNEYPLDRDMLYKNLSFQQLQ